MTEHHLTVQRTARFYTIGELTDQTSHAIPHRIWFCLHGFGQLAKYFSRKFSDLNDGQTLIVVPEGLSRLYLNGEYERVGASWMTREDRDYEINDFLGYLNTLYDQILYDRNSTEFHITLLGFSQVLNGLPLLNAGHIRADRLILWAGYFPNGLSDLVDPAKLTGVDCHYVYGKQDEYLVELSDMDSYLNRLQTDVPSLKLTAFEGGHRVESDVLKTILMAE